jgi:hypothetical protein
MTLRFRRRACDRRTSHRGKNGSSYFSGVRYVLMRLRWSGLRAHGPDGVVFTEGRTGVAVETDGKVNRSLL